MFRMSCLGDRSVVASCLRRNLFCLFVFFFFYETANRKSNQEQLCRLLFLFIYQNTTCATGRLVVSFDGTCSSNVAL